MIFVVPPSSFLILGWGPAVAELLKKTIGVLVQNGKKRTYTVLRNKQTTKPDKKKSV